MVIDDTVKQVVDTMLRGLDYPKPRIYTELPDQPKADISSLKNKGEFYTRLRVIKMAKDYLKRNGVDEAEARKHVKLTMLKYAHRM